MHADTIGWLGTALFLVGGALTAHKWKHALVVVAIANAAYILVGWLSSLPSLVAVSVLMAAIDLYGWHKWQTKTGKVPR